MICLRFENSIFRIALELIYYAKSAVVIVVVFTYVGGSTACTHHPCASPCSMIEQAGYQHQPLVWYTLVPRACLIWPRTRTSTGMRTSCEFSPYCFHSSACLPTEVTKPIIKVTDLRTYMTLYNTRPNYFVYIVQ